MPFLWCELLRVSFGMRHGRQYNNVQISSLVLQIKNLLVFFIYPFFNNCLNFSSLYRYTMFSSDKIDHNNLFHDVDINVSKHWWLQSLINRFSNKFALILWLEYFLILERNIYFCGRNILVFLFVFFVWSVVLKLISIQWYLDILNTIKAWETQPL